jgi:hypothetical protein
MARIPAALKLLVRILIAVAVAVALFFIARWGWRTWRVFGGFIIHWWRETLADPILRILIRVLDLADGNLLLFLAVVAVATWLLAKVFFGTVLMWSAANTNRLSRTAIENTVASVEDIHGRLRNMFADDVEKIAFYESRLGTRGQAKSATRSQLLGYGGCLLSLLWALLGMPISVMINLAVFDGVLRLVSGHGDRQALTSAAGPLAGMLQLHFPPPTHYLGIALQERSVLLTLLVVIAGMLHWLVLNISASGRTLPVIKPVWIWLTVIPPAICIYFILNGLLLFWTLVTTVVWIFDSLWKRVWRGLYLRIQATVFPWRREQEKRSAADGPRNRPPYTTESD